MEITDSVELVAGVPVMVVTPALVEIAKQNGLPVRFAGVAAMVFAFTLLVVAEVALEGVPSSGAWTESIARWLIGGVVYGMAAAGLYSQGRLLSEHQVVQGR